MINILYKETEYKNCSGKVEIIFRLRKTINETIINDVIQKEILLSDDMKFSEYFIAIESTIFSFQETKESKNIMISANTFHTSYLLEVITNIFYKENLIGDMKILTIVNYSEGDNYYEDFLEWCKIKGITYQFLKFD